MRAASILRTAVLLPVLLLVTLALSPGAILAAPLGLDQPFFIIFSRFFLWLAGARLTVAGAEKLPDRPVVLVCNHESNVDFAAVILAAGRPARFVGKRGLFWIPLFGWALRATGNIPVSRGERANPQRDLAMVKRALQKHSLIFFPEGTRTRDGRLRPFKKGAFVTAIQAGVPIVPMALAGGREILARGSLRVRPGPLYLVVGGPIPTEGLRYEDRDALMARAREAIVVLRAQARAALGLPSS